MRPRVVHVDTAASWRGGQNQVLLTAQGMMARGVATEIACRRGGELEARARAAGVSVEPVSFRGDLWPAGILALARRVRQQPDSVLLLHDPHAVSAGLIATRLGRRVPLVAVRRVDFPLRGAFSRAKYAACDGVIVVSSAIGSVMGRGGIASEQLALVYEGVPDRRPAPGGKEALAALGVPEDALVVGNVAALTAHKDHATLIDAMMILRAKQPQAWLVIAGEGELRGVLEAQARALGVADRTVFAGFRTDLDRLLPAFSIFCLSSHMEGLGTSLLDAMAFARPIVATRAGGIPEAVEDGVTGRVVPPRDPPALAQALLELLGDPARQEALGRAGRRRFQERFTADRMVENTLAVYAELT